MTAHHCGTRKSSKRHLGPRRYRLPVNVLVILRLKAGVWSLFLVSYFQCAEKDFDFTPPLVFRRYWNLPCIGTFCPITGPFQPEAVPIGSSTKVNARACPNRMAYIPAEKVALRALSTTAFTAKQIKKKKSDKWKWLCRTSSRGQAELRLSKGEMGVKLLIPRSYQPQLWTINMLPCCCLVSTSPTLYDTRDRLLIIPRVSTLWSCGLVDVVIWAICHGHVIICCSRKGCC